MTFLRSLAWILLLLAATASGILDAAANQGLIQRGVSAILIMLSLIVMAGCVGTASKDHRALLVNAILAGASVAFSQLVFTSLLQHVKRAG
jgi:hypothetical protein